MGDCLTYHEATIFGSMLLLNKEFQICVFFYILVIHVQKKVVSSLWTALLIFILPYIMLSIKLQTKLATLMCNA
jgi:hypothetical protein